jgi:HSP20 family protein
MTDKTKKERSRREEEPDSTALALPGFGMPRIFEDFMRPFDEFMQPFFPRAFGSLWTEFGGKEPNIDLQDRGDHYILTAELPGFDKKDVEVKISDNVLELKGEKRSEEESRTEEGSRVQSSSSYIQRYFTLPEEVVSENVSGTMKNGVLELKLPKKEPKAMDRSRKVDLK